MIYQKELSEKIIGCALEVHKQLGNGYLEKVYENALFYELSNNNINAEKQVSLKVIYKNQIIGEYFADIMVEKQIILELKVCNCISDIHKAQLLNYLKTTGIKIGYILNFGSKYKLEF